MQRLIGILVLLSLVGCGADVASSAATAAAVNAKQVEAAQHTRDHLPSNLEAASQQATKRLEDAEKAAQ